MRYELEVFYVNGTKNHGQDNDEGAYCNGRLPAVFICKYISNTVGSS